MKFNIYSSLTAVLGLMLLINGCSKDATSYQDYLGGKEKIYPGCPNAMEAAPGNYRVKLSWTPSPDPTVEKYRIFWNNGADSLEIAAPQIASTKVEVMITNLVEYSYSFRVYSYDEKGNRSVPVNLNNIKVYGDSYKASLTNRFLNTTTPYVLEGNDLTLNFMQPDTINTETRVIYTQTNGTEKTVLLSPENNSIKLEGYKTGTTVRYQSSYIPVRTAIDSFHPTDFSVLANIKAPLNKALFKEVKLGNDVGTYTGETSVSQLWNGNTAPTDYPSIFHSNSMNLPHYMTIDLGQTYTGLSDFEIMGRSSGYHNPIEFEIWGIDDLAGAPLVLPYTGSGKNWTLLKRVIRTGDGIAPYRVELDPTNANIRYIRLKILKVASNSSNTSNFSEITFWRQ